MTKRCLLPVALCFLFGLLFSLKNQYWIVCPFLILEVYIFLRLNKYNMKVRGHVLFGLLFVTFLFSLFYGKCCVQKREIYMSKLNQGDTVLAQGRLYKKEAKNERYYLFLDKGRILIDNDSVPCDEIMIQVDSLHYILGNTLVVRGRYKEFEAARNEGGYDEREVYFNKGITIKIDQIFSVSSYGKPYTFREFLYDVKEKMKGVMNNYLTKENAGVLSSVVLGDKTELTVEDKDSYSSAGISHILSVSGLHISLLCMGIFKLLRKVRIPILPSMLVSTLFSIVYCLFTGASVSTVRAVGMFIISMIAMILGEAYDIVSALSLLCIIILIDNPFALFSAGFLLSFSAVLGIEVTGKKLVRVYSVISDRRDYFRKVKRQLRRTKIPLVFEKVRSYFDGFEQMLLINVGIILTTLPFVAWFYYEIPTLSLIVNILVIPLMGVLLGLGFLGSALGVIISFLGRIIIPCGYIVEFYRIVANGTSKAGFSKWITGRPTTVCLVIYFGVLFMALFLLDKVKSHVSLDAGDRGESLSGDLRRFNRINAIYFVLVIGLVVLLVSILTVIRNHNACIKMLDVGQGDGIYISTGEADIFIDGGSSSIKQVGKYRIAPFLKYIGAGSIEYWIISHPDDDHISGFLELLEDRYTIENVIVSKYIVKNENFDKIRQLCDKNGIKLIYISPGDMLDFGKEKMTCLYPYSETSNENDASLVLFYETDDMDVLFTGDMGTDPEKELMNTWQWPGDNKTHILKVAHHGSKNSSDKDFLAMCSPDIALISSGQHNSYGHPHKETLEKLESLNCIIHRTDLEGEIILE